jgi:Asp/Glu/hydantoin racemase
MNAPTVAVIHTSPATVEVFSRLLAASLPQARLINLMDDSVLPQLRDNGGDVTAVAPRWTAYARIAREQGADLILNACSSIGELCAPVQRELGIRIVRVDAAMAAEAVEGAQRVAVVATLASTLGPTTRLLEETARAQGREVQVVSLLAEGAYAALMAGDRERHDDLVAATLAQAADRAERVVLAQASMARVLPRLAPAQQAKCLVSPERAVASVVQALRTR